MHVSGTTAREGRRVLRFLSTLQLSTDKGAERCSRNSLRVCQILQVRTYIYVLIPPVEKNSRRREADFSKVSSEEQPESEFPRYLPSPPLLSVPLLNACIRVEGLQGIVINAGTTDDQSVKSPSETLKSKTWKSFIIPRPSTRPSYQVLSG